MQALGALVRGDSRVLCGEGVCALELHWKAFANEDCATVRIAWGDRGDTERLSPLGALRGRDGERDLRT